MRFDSVWNKIWANLIKLIGSFTQTNPGPTQQQAGSSKNDMHTVIEDGVGT